MSTLSVVVHYRRTVVSDCYVNVPVTNKLMVERPDGSFGFDAEQLLTEGATYCDDPGVDWQVEQQSCEPHPVQGPVPDGRVVYAPPDDGIDWAGIEIPGASA